MQRTFYTKNLFVLIKMKITLLLTIVLFNPIHEYKNNMLLNHHGCIGMFCQWTSIRLLG